MLRLTSRSSTTQKFSIFRVPDQLRKVNQKAYEPQRIAIGPYSYKYTLSDNILQMQEHKKHYLRLLLERTGHDVSKYVKAMRNLEKQAREFYEVYNDLEDSEIWETDRFVKMLVLDGCFIVELIRKCLVKKLREVNDPIFLVNLNVKSIYRDILLIENQLPFFILSQLFEETASPNDMKVLGLRLKFNDLVVHFLRSIIPIPIKYMETLNIDEEPKHLLDFIHNIYRPSRPIHDSNKISGGLSLIRCATELREAGIKFKKADRRRYMFDLRFEKGNFEIPKLFINDQTESLIPNLIAYEQVGLNNNQSCYVTDYSFLMRWLISSPNDAKLLSGLGIIDNCLGDEVIIPQLFEKFGKNISQSSFHFFYYDVVKELNTHCQRKRTALIAKWNMWREKLWQEYFNSPWALISFLAACILLILTLIQTVYSVKSYYQ